MQDLDPLQLRDRLRKTLERYIATAVPVSPTRAPGLARAVRDRIADESSSLIQGPFLESLPDFQKKGSIQSLVDGGVLAPSWKILNQTGFESLLHRPLHTHQERAIRHSVSNRNFIVATGTGSGKTECFLLPIVDRLLREEDLSEPGVRAVIVYPLNALANDQLYFRLAPLLLTQLDDPGITFGRFTGQVRAHAGRREEEDRLLDNNALRQKLRLAPAASSLPRSWLLSRSEMLSTPPHILITNYAMLEHLLLLPRNAPLFENARLRFLVLDEIHTYAGAQAIEVAFLIRKLKTRLDMNAGELQAIGTSASLNIEDDQELARFASDLFGERFDANSDLISGTRKIHATLRRGPARKSISADIWINVGELVSELQLYKIPTVKDWNEGCEIYDALDFLLPDNPNSRLRQGLTDLLATIREVRTVARELKGGLRSFEDLATTVFPKAEREARSHALRSLVTTAVFARPQDNSHFPILPARYHLAVTGIEGGVVRLHKDEAEGWYDFRPRKSHSDENGVPYYGLLACRNCGEAYLEGWLSGNGIMAGKPLPGARRTVFRIKALARPRSVEVGAGDREAPEGDEELLYIDAETGRTGSAATSASVPVVLCALQEDTDEKRHYLTACVACGARARRFPEPISPLHPGDHALSAVATQVLLEAIPDKGDDDYPKPLAGRKLLAFSDNRQDAAFFAPFFQRTSLDLTLRGCIAQAVRQDADESAISIPRVRDKVWALMRASGQEAFKSHHWDGGDRSDTEAKQTLEAQVVSEFFTSGLVRVSLESLGIASVEYDRRTLDRLVKKILEADTGLEGSDARAFAELVLDLVRRSRAIASKGTRFDLSNDAIWGPFQNQQQRCVVLSKERGQKSSSTVGLLPTGRGSNRFTWILLNRLKLGRDKAFQLIETLWTYARMERLLILHHRGYGLNLDKVRIVDGRKLSLYECGTCGTRTFRSISSFCPSWKCSGTLKRMSDQERRSLLKHNHYAYLYLREFGTLGKGWNAVAKEHSAVIGGHLREMIEERFRTGRINLLSCTTTLELGVDLGDLEATVCRNVPPGIVSYQQRTGRAGRRAQAAPVALTIARNGNYDQSCFRSFSDYLAARPAVPYLALDNADFFRRHQVSIVLAGFLRRHIVPTGTGAPRLKALVGDTLDESRVNAFLDVFREWSESGDGVDAHKRADRLVSTLPEQYRRIGLEGDELKSHVLGVLRRFVDEIACRWRLLQRRRMEAREADRDVVAAIIQRQQHNLLQQFLINALSRSAVIPTYSFPVHTCRLEIIKGKGQPATPFGDLEADLQMDRAASLAISEYAPGAEVVAGDRIWTSSGIVRYPKEFMPTQYYKICNSCGHVAIRDSREELNGKCPQCSESLTASHRQGCFIEPKGFLTSLAGRRGRSPGATRLRERYAEEARLVTRAPFHRYEDTDLPGVRTFYSPAFPTDGNSDSSGRLLIINRGPYGGGYLRCHRCEYAAPAESNARWGKVVRSRHRNPRTDERCPVTELAWPVDLGHIFETDVRAFYFNRLIPRFDGDDIGGLTESFLRTLAEAVRLAAVRLLQTDSRDLAATFQQDNGRPATILFDSVPGGAGYSRRLGGGGALSTRHLVERAIGVLDCPSNCASSCSKCLNDYGNQANWEMFDRNVVLPWLRALQSGVRAEESMAATGAVRWAAPSLLALEDRLRGSRIIEIFVPRIADGQGRRRAVETARFIRGQLRSVPDRRVRIYSEHSISDSVIEPTAEELNALTVLAQAESEGRLEFLISGRIDRESSFPRLATDIASGGQCFHAEESDRPLLEGLLPGGSVFVEGTISVATRTLVEDLKRHSLRKSNALAQLVPDTKRFEYRGGQRRDLGELFACLRGVGETRITIRDPYLLSQEHNLESAAELLEFVNSRCEGIRIAKLVWRQQSPTRTHGAWDSRDAIRRFKSKLRKRGLEQQWVVRYQPRRRGEGGHFHDRRIFADIVRRGAKERYRWDLTSGVDGLMDRSSEACVFLSRLR